MNRSIERMLANGELTFDEMKVGRKVGGISRERAMETAEDLLRRAGWRLAGIDPRGAMWSVQARGQDVMGDGHRMDVGLTFDLDQNGKPRNIEISGYLDDGTESRPRRVSRLVSPRNAARELSP